MPTVDGQQAPLLAPGKVNVVVFVRVGQEFSATALRQLAQLEREVSSKPVRIALVFSDSDAPADVAAMLVEAGSRGPALVDRADALYGELGVAMTPSAGIVGKDRKLAGFQPFRKVNYLDAMRAQVAFALGEIDRAALARALDPAAAPIASGGRAHARLTLGRRLLAAGDAKGAIASARAAIGIDPGSAEAHALLAEALAKGGECDEAAREAAQARSLSPSAPPLADCARR
jgi:tetratricopeptide (TPR) repeat protein